MPSLIDVAKSLDPNGKVAIVAELLNQSNELIQYMNFIEGNLPTGHKAVVRAGLPTVTLRRFYKGVAPSQSGRDTIEDVCAMQEGRNEIDKDLADLNGNAEAFRMSESLAFIESMNQTFAQQIVYGNTSTNKDGILGLAPRYNAISGATNGQNIINAGGGASNDNTSVWLVIWGENTVSGIYPKGSKAGLVQEDLGVIDAFDSSHNRFRAYGEIYQWKYGLHVKDWRYAVRIANIKTGDLIAQTGTQANTVSTWLPLLMMKAFARIPSMGMGNATFLANRTVKEMLSVAAVQKTIYGLKMEEAGNQFGTVAPGSVAGQGTGIRGGQLKFFGTPVLTVDQILSTEAAIS
ncbi:MAG: major capsid protein [Terracidiphilus sp.]